MVLIYDRAPFDPRIERLTDEAHRAWWATVSLCNKLGREIISTVEIEESFVVYAEAGHPIDVPAVISELVAADLARQLPDGQIKMLARLDLWAFDGEAEPDFIIGPPGDD